MSMPPSFAPREGGRAADSGVRSLGSYFLLTFHITGTGPASQPEMRSLR
jgi:hypothetical protein